MARAAARWGVGAVAGPGLARHVVTGDVSARGRAWRHGTHSAICDVIEPWEHGTVVRATRYPSYYDFNLVRVERDPGLAADELVAAPPSRRSIELDLEQSASAPA